MEGIQLYPISYFEKSVFKGSYRGMNFHIEKKESSDGSVLRVTAWKGPKILEKTEETVYTKDFPFDDDGIQKADQWLTGQLKELL